MSIQPRTRRSPWTSTWRANGGFADFLAVLDRQTGAGAALGGHAARAALHAQAAALLRFPAPYRKRHWDNQQGKVAPMTNKSTRTVLFDVDGTLTNSTYFHGVSWWQALRQSGITSLTAAIHRAVGMGGQERLHHFLGFGTTPEQADALNEAHDAIFSTHRPALISFSAAKELLEHGVPTGAAVVLASSAQKPC